MIHKSKILSRAKLYIHIYVGFSKSAVLELCNPKLFTMLKVYAGRKNIRISPYITRQVYDNNEPVAD